MDDLAKRLQRLELIEGARKALNDYCLALDSYNLTLLRDTFTDDVIVNRAPDSPLVGIEPVMAFFEMATAERLAHRKHYNTNVSIDVMSPLTAAGHSLFFAYSGETDALKIAWGRYDFEVRAEEGKFLISRFDIVLDLPQSSLDAFVAKS